MESKVETKHGQCPLCLEPVFPNKGDKIVLVWGKPGHFKCALRAQVKFDPYVEGSEKPVEKQVAVEKSPPATASATHREALIEKNEPPKKAKTVREKASSRTAKHTA